MFGYLTDYQGILIHESVSRNFQVQRSRPFADATRSVVVGAVTRAVITTKVPCAKQYDNFHSLDKTVSSGTRVSDRDATKMRADSQQNKPLRLLSPFGIVLWIAKRRKIYILFCINLSLK